MENRINEIMELADGSKYIIVKQAIYKGENYYVAVRVTDDEEDIKDIESEKNFRVLHEVMYEGNLSVEDVNDPSMYKLIIKYVGLEEE